MNLSKIAEATIGLIVDVDDLVPVDVVRAPLEDSETRATLRFPRLEVLVFEDVLRRHATYWTPPCLSKNADDLRRQMNRLDMKK